jgi:hypothetical protein
VADWLTVLDFNERGAEMDPKTIDFLKGLATDPDGLAGYIADPDGAMTAAGIPDDDKQILLNNDFTKVSATFIFFIATMAPSTS